MDINIILTYIGLHWEQLLIDLIALDHIVLISAQKWGYTKVTSLCQKFANLLGFIWDIVVGMSTAAGGAFMSKFQKPEVKNDTK